MPCGGSGEWTAIACNKVSFALRGISWSGETFHAFLKNLLALSQRKSLLRNVRKLSRSSIEPISVKFPQGKDGPVLLRDTGFFFYSPESLEFVGRNFKNWHPVRCRAAEALPLAVKVRLARPLITPKTKVAKRDARTANSGDVARC